MFAGLHACLHYCMLARLLVEGIQNSLQYRVTAVLLLIFQEEVYGDPGMFILAGLIPLHLVRKAKLRECFFSSEVNLKVAESFPTSLTAFRITSIMFSCINDCMLALLLACMLACMIALVVSWCRGVLVFPLSFFPLLRVFRPFQPVREAPAIARRALPEARGMQRKDYLPTLIFSSGKHLHYQLFVGSSSRRIRSVVEDMGMP